MSYPVDSFAAPWRRSYYVDFAASGSHLQDIFFTGLENDIGLPGGAHNGYLDSCPHSCHGTGLQVLPTEGVRAQYEIDLAASGMMDGPPSPFITSDRLALLKERNAAWESLRRVDSQDIPMMQGQVWELYGGVFAQSSTPDVGHLFWMT
jgi:hypothetical protein